MKFSITFFLIFSFTLIGVAQSLESKRLELKRLTFKNKYKGVGYFDTLTGIATVYDNGREGYLNSSGKLILPINYVTRDFSDGIGIYQDIEKNTFKAIDKNGNFIKEFKNINSLHGFRNRRSIFSAYTSEGVKYGVIDFDGNIVIENKYPYIDKISEKYFYVNSNKDGAGIINAIGDTIIPVEYGIYYIDTSDLHFIGSKKDLGYAIFDSFGHVIKFLGKDVYPEASYIEGVPYFQRDSVIILKDQWSSSGAQTALVNLNFDTIVPMGKYYISAVNEGFVKYYDREKEKVGFLNTKGEIVIPANFDFAHYFTERVCAIKKNNKWGYIDQNGSIVIPIEFDYALPFYHGYAKVEIKGKYFIINRKGKTVLNSNWD